MPLPGLPLPGKGREDKRRLQSLEKPTREEMIRMAQETRKNVTSAPVSEEEMQQYPVSMELM